MQPPEESNVESVEQSSSPRKPFIELSVNLPDRYALSSIQRFHTGEWVVCLHIKQPGEWTGLYHALGQHTDVNEATRLAMERCETKREMMEAIRAQGPGPIVHTTKVIPGLDFSTLKL